MRVLQRLRLYLLQRCASNELWRGQEVLSDEAFLDRFGRWNGPLPRARCSSIWTNTPGRAQGHDGLAGHHLRAPGSPAQAGVHADREEHRPARHALQLNPAERAILLYGTLARYQRELRGALVEFKVNTAHEAFAAIAAVAGVDEREVAEALRAGSRLERIGMVENLISSTTSPTLPT